MITVNRLSIGDLLTMQDTFKGNTFEYDVVITKLFENAYQVQPLKGAITYFKVSRNGKAYRSTARVISSTKK